MTNKMNFCPYCGKQKPIKEWVCECGMKNTLNFCPNCGNPKPSSSKRSRSSGVKSQGLIIENGILRVYNTQQGQTAIIIPDGVEEIGDSCFFGHQELIHIIIPNTVKIIGKSAFAECSHLQNITIPKSVTVIDAEAFSGCKNLTLTLFLPEYMEYIAEDAFIGCKKVIRT